MKPYTSPSTAFAFRGAATTAALLVLASPLFAQQTPKPEAEDEPLQLEKFVVSTGSRFQDRTFLTSPIPVDVISLADLRAGGRSELTESIAFETPSMNFMSMRPAADNAPTRTFAFRGLPGSQTLVLVNGKRWHTTTNGSGNPTFDFNSIPPTAISNVEILRDGASAQYGSDAISGVVNLFLKTDLRTEMQLTVGQYYQGDGLTKEVSFDTGVPLRKTGFLHVTAYGRYSDMSNRQGRDNRQFYFATNAAGNPVILPVVSASDTTPVVGAGITLNAKENSAATENVRNHDQVSGNPKRREGAFDFNLEFPLTDVTRAYAFGGYAHRRTDVPAIFRRPLEDQVVRGLYPDGVQSTKFTVINDVNLAGGLKGKASDWDWDLSESWGFNKLTRYSSDNNNPSLGLASPRNFYAGYITIGQATTNLDLKRSFNVGLRSPLRLAAGSEFRTESMKVVAGEPAVYQNGGVPILDGPNVGRPAPVGAVSIGFYTPTDETDRSRNSIAGYLDVENQLTDKLLVTAAGRYERYSDFGSTINGKVSFLQQFTKAFAVRGSLSTGFRAPHLIDSYFSSTGNQLIGATFFVTRQFPQTDPVAIALGATPLTPEKSTNQSVGFTLGLSENLSLTVDAYRLRVKDNIVNSSAFNDAATRTFLASRGFANITSASYRTNAVDTRAEGIDVQGQFRHKFSEHDRFTFTAVANFNQPRVTRVAATPPQVTAITTIRIYNDARRLQFERGSPHSRLNFSARHTHRKWEFFIRTSRYPDIWGDYTGLTVPQLFAAKWLTDAEISYDATKALRVSVGGRNVFDQYADPLNAANNPSVWAPYSSNGNFMFDTNGGYFYLRLSYRR